MFSIETCLITGGSIANTYEREFDYLSKSGLLILIISIIIITNGVIINRYLHYSLRSHQIIINSLAKGTEKRIISYNEIDQSDKLKFQYF